MSFRGFIGVYIYICIRTSPVMSHEFTTEQPIKVLSWQHEEQQMSSRSTQRTRPEMRCRPDCTRSYQNEINMTTYRLTSSLETFPVLDGLNVPPEGRILCIRLNGVEGLPPFSLSEGTNIVLQCDQQQANEGGNGNVSDGKGVSNDVWTISLSRQQLLQRTYAREEPIHLTTWDYTQEIGANLGALVDEEAGTSTEHGVCRQEG